MWVKRVFLKTRINKHRNANTTQRSVISDHRMQNHEFDWSNVEILDREPNLCKRLISEMIYIKRQRNGLNLQSDTEQLDHIYFPILENMSKI